MPDPDTVFMTIVGWNWFILGGRISGSGPATLHCYLGRLAESIGAGLPRPTNTITERIPDTINVLLEGAAPHGIADPDLTLKE